MPASTSPDGQPHPGSIEHIDEVDGRTWTASASEVPPTIAWVQTSEGWQAVTTIKITGTAARRRFTKYNAAGVMLETTVQAPPPPRP